MLLAVSGDTRGKVLSLVACSGNCVWQPALVTRLGGASVATGHKMLLGSWARIFRAWYPDGTGAYLAQHTFLLMFQTGVS